MKSIFSVFLVVTLAAPAYAESDHIVRKALRYVQEVGRFAARFPALVRDLGDDEFDIREKASEELERWLSEPGAGRFMPVVQKAIDDSEDAEVRRRLQLLVGASYQNWKTFFDDLRERLQETNDTKKLKITASALQALLESDPVLGEDRKQLSLLEREAPPMEQHEAWRKKQAILVNAQTDKIRNSVERVLEGNARFQLVAEGKDLQFTVKDTSTGKTYLVGMNSSREIKLSPRMDEIPLSALFTPQQRGSLFKPESYDAVLSLRGGTYYTSDQTYVINQESIAKQLSQHLLPLKAAELRAVQPIPIPTPLFPLFPAAPPVPRP